MSDHGSEERTRKHRQSLLLPILIPLGALAVIGIVLFGFSRILLGVSHNSATVVACVVALVILVVGGIVAGQRRVGPAAIGSMLGVVTGAALMTGSLAFLIVGPQQEEVEPEVVTLAAGPNASVEGFEPETLAFPADVPVDLEFDNEETGIQHNVVIYREDPAEDSAQTPLLDGQLISGPASVTYAVPPVPEGSYFFLCEVHPTTMTGTIRAAPGGSPPGPTVVAQGLAFDTDQIELPADVPSSITLDNQDAGTDHNIAIYPDDTLGEPLFEGELITGPATEAYPVPPLEAGSYYFLCDVHPSMNGTVKVAAEAGGGGGGGDGGGGSGSPPPSAPPTESPPPPDGGGGGAEATITAAALAFDTSSLSFPADTPVLLTLDNQEPGVQHNVSIFADEAYTQPEFPGELITGPATITYSVPPLAAGTHYFRCDVHPTMAGTVSVT